MKRIIETHIEHKDKNYKIEYTPQYRTEGTGIAKREYVDYNTLITESNQVILMGSVSFDMLLDKMVHERFNIEDGELDRKLVQGIKYKEGISDFM